MPSTKSIAIGSGAGVLLIIAVVAVIFLFPKSGSLKGTISEEQLSNATNFLIKEKGTAKFISNNKTYIMRIDSILEKYINLTILNTTIITKINLGQIRNFDLEEDGTKDITIQLINISDNKANLSIKKFFECIENWTCTEWSACNGKNQTRKCTDTTNCATDSDKPKEFQECEFNCSMQNGKICINSQTCNGTTTTASDGECCLGTCEGKAVGIEIGSCEDIDCLISAAETCSIANLTYSSTFKNSTWEQTTSSYYKIRGLDGDNCKLYKEVMDVTGSYTTTGKQVLTAAGKTDAEITQMEEDMENSIGGELIGETGICRFSTYNLVERLQELEDGNAFITEDELENYDCSGNLVWKY